MKTSFFFVFRIAAAWVFAYLVFITLWNGFLGGPGPNGLVFLVFLITLGFVIASAVSHIRRIRLIAGDINPGTLANRQRRQIEIPLEAGVAFDLVDATIRELPRSEDIESARDSLQVRAKVARINPYSNKTPGRFNPLYWIHIKRNQILATVTPGDGISSLTLVCEPESGAWSDWFKVDDGTNLENAEAITRAITRRIAEHRRNEQAAAQQTVTEKELTVAKLSLLHAQVEPHFLYNTLASAQYLTRSDPARADEMLGNLITYLRHSLPRTEDSLSTLGEELERARAYLEILKIRMGNRLNLQIEVPEALKSIPFPAMMLQTLVENAIKHGLEPKSGGGTVWIIARTIDDSLAVTVADDGQGFNAGSSGTGIGLKNVRERLRLAYGGAASFAIVANFPSGVAATINIPANDIPAKAEEGSHV
ncbi:sensor histidine kinase [Pseudoxanthomonas yeongjuensis]|uniref:sensor histidine kinase n=1 Tax=Pseudoxanthomonas yeongjuensis TaxID=377616 RepID=UPI0013914794|nr:histidine kinase [Pseudoxanthomonas yeongjuensis]KAF1714651.1 sensor histidine kinase [Pseudoxanthomonas yeongjuensis]